MVKLGAKKVKRLTIWDGGSIKLFAWNASQTINESLVVDLGALASVPLPTKPTAAAADRLG